MARKSSRKYHKSRRVYDSRIIKLGLLKNQQTGILEQYYGVLHPEAPLFVKVVGEEKTVFLGTYRGWEHIEDRMAVFDEGHLKRVSRTFVQSAMATAKGRKVKNAVMHKEDYLKQVTTSKLKLGL